MGKHRGEKHDFTFKQLKYYSDKTANFLASKGIGKGDTVMLILKRHYEYWWTILALHEAGGGGDTGQQSSYAQGHCVPLQPGVGEGHCVHGGRRYFKRCGRGGACLPTLSCL